MNKKCLVLITGFLLIYNLPLFGSNPTAHGSKITEKKNNIVTMLGKPTVDTTVQGLHITMWLITQKQHKRVLKSKSGKEMIDKTYDGFNIDKTTKGEMITGTHHFILLVSNADTKKEIVDAVTKIQIENPSKVSSFIDLKPMMNQYRKSLVLKEKGAYRITVSVTVEGFTRDKEFIYRIK